LSFRRRLAACKGRKKDQEQGREAANRKLLQKRGFWQFQGMRAHLQCHSSPLMRSDAFRRAFAGKEHSSAVTRQRFKAEI
jgi:hypothetical protein